MTMDPVHAPLSGRIVGAEIVRRPVPLRRPLRGARGVVHTRSIRILHLTADDGCAGLGEGSGVDWLTAAPGTEVAAHFRALVERIRSDQPAASTLLAWSMDEARPSSLRAALQTALLDVEARRRGVSLAAFLGAPQEPATMEVSALVGDDEPAAMAREAAALVADGFRCFKLKVGRSDLEGDLARAAVVRTVIGTDCALRLDANRAWSFEHAQAALTAFAASRPDMIEEPLFDETELPRLDARVRVALDESVRSRAELERAIARGGFQVLVLKLERAGGPLAALTMAEVAAAAGIEVVFNDSIESPVGRAATAHVAAAAHRRTGFEPRPLGLGGLLLLDDAPRSPRPAFVVDGPGLGIDVEQTISGGPG